MRGIAGVFYRDRRPAEKDTATSMLTAMPHRARAGCTAWAGRSVALAHGAPAPPSSLGGSAIVADLRIDNRHELAAALGIESARREVVSDAELLLEAYLTWDDDCFDRVVGDFACAIWDERIGSLVCARDRFGAKPLCYAVSDRWFAFGSEPKALHAIPEVSREIDEEFVCLHFNPELLLEDRTITASRGVVRLEPAHILHVSPDGIRTRRYWAFDEFRESELTTDRAYFARFRELFHQSVSRRLRTDNVVASTLSGGLDSSSVTCVARDILRSDAFPAYAAVFDDVPSADESPWIRAVVESGGIDLRVVHPDAESPLIDIDTALWLSDGPFYGTNYFIQWHLMRAASADGVGVLLDGEMGDTVVSHGTDLLAQLVQRGEWELFDKECDSIVKNFANEETYASKPGMVRAHAVPYLESLASHGHWVAFYRTARELTRRFGIPARRLVVRHGIKKTRAFAALRRMVRPNRGAHYPAGSVLRAEMAEKYRVAERLRDLREGFNASRYPAHPRQNHYDSLRSGAIAYALESVERIGAYWGLDVRHPFCDREFAEFCLSVPPELKLRDGISRHVLREGLADSLPDAVRLRTGKGDLAEVFSRGLSVFERSSLTAPDAATRSDDAERFIDRESLAAQSARFAAGDESGGATELWRAVTLARWCDSRDFRDGPTESRLKKIYHNGSKRPTEVSSEKSV